MNSPLPTANKKPIPTPRRTKMKDAQNKENKEENSSQQQKTETNTNTFSRRVSKSTKQIAGDINQLVQDRKKAVIASTRQSVRRIRNRFSSGSEEAHSPEVERSKNDGNDDSIDIFNTIRFESPLSRSTSIYNNVEDNSSTESLYIPPPNHPPPPLPALPTESFYDAPPSLASSSNSDTTKSKKSKIQNYESVFPPYPYNSDSESCVDFTETILEPSNEVSRCSSWKFYDTANENHKEDNIYNNIAEKEGTDVTDDAASSSRFSVEVRNSFYENHEIVSKHKEMMRPSKSVILQFDPLTNENDNQQSQKALQYDMKLLEDLLQGDLYSTISTAHTIDNWSISNESEADDGTFLNPPTPPERIDSLPEDETGTPEVSVGKLPSPKSRTRTSWFTDAEPQPTANFEQKKTNWFKQVKGVLEKAPEVVRGQKKSENVVARPSLGANFLKQKRGMLYKVQSGPVEDLFGEYSGRWCVLENGKFVCYSDNTRMHLKEHFLGENILSVQILQDTKYKYRYDNDDLHCFELNTTGKSRGGHVYGAKDISERRVWMQLIAESLTNRFKSKLTSSYSRMGWAYVREGVSGKWLGAWIILAERELHYAIDNQPVKTMDLRKARCIVLQSYQENDNNPKTNDKGPNMLVDCPDLALYLRMWTSRETKVWCHIVKLEAHNNGANLEDQQLTKNDIPVIVEKCINFIYAHGSMSEGIYRKTGTGSSVSELLTKFRKDAFSLQLTTDTCTEHEVATALKRFLRDLPEPLLGCDHRLYLHEVAKHSHQEEKIRMFKAALDQLPSVSYKTARKLLGHLHFISSQSAKNLMTIENLSAIWGPTLMHFEDDGSKKNSSCHKEDSEVVCQLIKYYRSIFPEDPGELEKEKIMLRVLQKHLSSPQGGVSKKSAGDLRLWIYMHNSDGKSYNVAIGPNKTAYDVCLELKDKIKLPVHEIILEEVVLNGKLTRPIHHGEKVLDIVLNWSYWDENDRKDNIITLVNLSKYWEYIIDKPLPVSGELKFADNRTKTFKVLTFQFSQGNLMYFKDKTGETVLNSWKIEEITWYLGHEAKRNPHSRWTMTFVEHTWKPNRTKMTPFFGHVLVWNDASSRASWLSAMLKARYPNNFVPPPNFIGI